MSALQQIHWLDITILMVMAVGFLIGAIRGVLRQTFRLAAQVAVLSVALFYHASVDEAIRTRLPAEAGDFSRVHSFVVTYLAAWLVYAVAASLVLRGLTSVLRDRKADNAEEVVKALGLSAFDRMAGACVGTVASCLLIGVALIGLGSIQDAKLQNELAASKLAPQFVSRTRAALAAVPSERTEQLFNSLNRLDSAFQAVATDMAGDRVSGLSQFIDALVKGMSLSR